MTNKKEEAIAKMNDECRPLLAALTKLSDEYNEVVLARSAQLAEGEQVTYIASRNLLIGVCLLAVGFAIGAG